MTKIVINNCYGGFSVSAEAMKRYAEIKGMELLEEDVVGWGSLKRYYYMEDGRKNYVGPYDFNNRTDPALVQVVEELGEKANGYCAKLFIDEIETGTQYRIAEYDGQEWIETPDDIEWSVS